MNERDDEIEGARQGDRIPQHLAWLEELKTRPRPTCPRCDSSAYLIPILYDVPEHPMFATENLFIRGGSEESPDKWYCRLCGASVPKALSNDFTAADVDFLKN